MNGTNSTISNAMMCGGSFLSTLEGNLS